MMNPGNLITIEVLGFSQAFFFAVVVVFVFFSFFNFNFFSSRPWDSTLASIFGAEMLLLCENIFI